MSLPLPYRRLHLQLKTCECQTYQYEETFRNAHICLVQTSQGATSITSLLISLHNFLKQNFREEDHLDATNQFALQLHHQFVMSAKFLYDKYSLDI